MLLKEGRKSQLVVTCRKISKFGGVPVFCGTKEEDAFIAVGVELCAARQ